ncbi:hypothetical protein [Kitasatospora sp. NPDC059327]|uniref:hypothetical protein n=1 Tax=Kitasatospora sp. NPDC059327 TaxID=3346803 RepID=UPI003685A032
MSGQATGTAAGRRRDAAVGAAGAVALLLALAGCSSAGTAAAPSASAPQVRTTDPAPTTTAPTASPTRPASPTLPVPPAPQPTSPDAVPSEPAPAPARIYGCEGRSLTEPKSFPLACGKGAAQLDGLVWTGWGGLSPTAKGRLWEQNAAGGLAANPATVTLGGLTGGDYTTLRISAPKAERPNLELALGRSGPAPKG